MARRIRDVALALDVVVGPDPRDIRSLPAKGVSWVDALRNATPPKRAAWSPTLGYAEVDDEIRAVCEAACKQLEALGTEVIEIEKVFDSDPGTHVGALVSSFTLRTVEAYLGDDRWKSMDPLVVIAAEMAKLTTSAVDVVRAYDACHLVNAQLQDVLDDFDVLLTPTVCGTTAPSEAMTTAPELLARLGGIETFDTSELPPGLLEEMLGKLMAMGSFNFPMGTVNGQTVLEWTRMTQPFNLTRSPAGTTNAGFTSAGMPVGLQIVGRQHDDVAVLQTIAVLEDELGIPTAPI
jgi:aspartyl-tRNA(Asn)/glutamyl-tRNA(Gln) amidotransferase subunit A